MVKSDKLGVKMWITLTRYFGYLGGLMYYIGLDFGSD